MRYLDLDIVKINELLKSKEIKPIDLVNEALGTNFSTLEEVLFNTKAAFVDSGVFSPVVVLFNSELFSTMIGIEEEKEEESKTKSIGRNELCPCGSGLKYKKCCGK